MTRHWSYHYIGIPWAPYGTRKTDPGLSCHGLRNLVYREVRGIELPEYRDTATDTYECNEIESILSLKHSKLWTKINLQEATEFDIVTFHMRGVEKHVGTLISNTHMLHVGKGISTSIERFSKEPWSSLHPTFFRYNDVQLLNRTTNIAKLSDPRYPHIMRTMSEVERTVFMEPGGTILDAIKVAFPNVNKELLADIRVTIGYDVISRDYWHVVRPKQWDIVIIRVVPSALFDFLRIAFMIAVVVAAAAVSGGLLGPVVGGGFLAAGSTSALLAGAAISVLGSLLISALLPAAGNKATTPVYTISGFQNTVDADGVVPSVLGTIRFAPPFAALPYTEINGDDRWCRAIFLIGYGPVGISDPMIGNTPISSFTGIQLEIKNGYDDDTPVSLYPQTVIEDNDNPPAVTHDDPAVTRNTAPNVWSAEIELYFATGLIAYNTSGTKKPYQVDITIEYRAAGSSTWTDMNVPQISAFQAKAFWRTFDVTFPARGQYEIRVTRHTVDDDDQNADHIPDEGQSGTRSTFVSTFQWSALRSYRPEYPLNYKTPMALIGIRIKASAQLSGMINNFSVLCKRTALDWNADSATWALAFTNNPAALYRLIHQGKENAYPRSDAELDLGDIQDWYEYCDTKGLHYNAVHNSDQSQDDALDAVAGAGRALKHDRGDKWSIIIDKTRTTFTGAISPANSTSFSLVNTKSDFPDAFTVSFFDETYLYGTTKRVIPWPDHVGDIVTVVDLQLPGKTNPDEVWIEARRRQYEAILRRNTYSVQQDMENLVVTRGDAILANHQILLETQAAGYVKLVADDGKSCRVDSTLVQEEGSSYRIRFRRPDSTTFLRTVLTVPGNSSSVAFSGTGEVPQIGDLALFGQVGFETIECVVKNIEAGDNFTATLSLIDHAPDIDTLTDAEVPPAWDGVIGGEVDFDGTTPTIPIIQNVFSGQGASAYDTLSDPHPVAVVVVPGLDNASRITAYQLRYRVTGGSTWTVVTAYLPSQGVGIISGHSLGDSLDIQARAINGGNASDYTDTTTHVLGSNDILILNVDTFTAVHDIASGFWHYSWTLETPVSGVTYVDIAGIKLKYGLGTGLTWGDLDDLGTGYFTASPVDLTVPVANVDYTIGAVTVATDGTEGTPDVIDVAHV